MTTLADLVDPMMRQAGSKLFGDSARRCVTDAARLLPPLSGVILELPLNDRNSGVDLSVRASPDDGGREILAGDYGWRHPLTPEWRHIVSFCRSWGISEAQSSVEVKTLWLEFDLHLPCGDFLTPSVFVDLKRRSLSDMSDRVNVMSELLRGQPLVKFERRNLLYFLGALPKTGSPRHIGFMLSRPDEGIRLVFELRRREVARYLSSVKASLDHNDYSWIQAPDSNLADLIYIHLDLKANDRPAVGFELKPSNAHKWPALLDEVTEYFPLGTANFLLNWPAQSSLLEGGYMPPELTMQPLADPREVKDFLFIRRINHLKIIQPPDLPNKIKGYVYAGFLWRR